MKDEKQMVADVAVIGTGGAGLAAAIESHDAGARVVLLEQAATPGGASIISGGGCFIVGSPLQKEHGINDSPDLAFEDWVKWGQGSADEQWARYYIEHTLHDLYFWVEALGVKWVDMKSQEGNRVARWHRPANNGLGLTTALINAASDRGAKEILTSIEATEILIQNGRVRGLKAINNEEPRSKLRGIRTPP